MPAEELARLDGLCSSSSGTFSGEIHNGSGSWTIREVTIRLTLNEKVIPDIEEFEKLLKKYGGKLSDSQPGTLPDATLAWAPQRKSRDYQIRNLSIRPLETGHVSVEVLTPPGSVFVQWKLIAAKGFKGLWRGIAQTGGAPPVPSATATPQASSAEPDEFDKLLAQTPSAKEPKFKVSPEEFLRREPSSQSASKSERILQQAPTLPPKDITFKPGDFPRQALPPLPKGLTAAPPPRNPGKGTFDLSDIDAAPPQAVKFKASEIPQQAQPVQSLPPLPKGYRFADQPAAGAPASKSERTLRQGPTLPPSLSPIPAETPLSIKDAENAGFVRTSFRNPEGNSSGDSVVLVVVKIGGPDRLLLTIPPGLLLKSPLPASQDMIIAGLRGRDAGGGKYAPASTITLTDGQPARYVIEAYCAQFHRDNPPADKFDFGVGTPVEPGMVCVLNEARNQGLSVAGTQAAVWIHAEHLTFSEMNTRMSIGLTEWSRAEAVALRCASR